MYCEIAPVTFYFLNVATRKFEITYVAQIIFLLDSATLEHEAIGISELYLKPKPELGIQRAIETQSTTAQSADGGHQARTSGFGRVGRKWSLEIFFGTYTGTVFIESSWLCLWVKKELLRMPTCSDITSITLQLH